MPNRFSAKQKHAEAFESGYTLIKKHMSKQLQDFENRAVRHGEIMLVPMEEIPAEAKQIFSGEKYIVGHSETGHHHVAVGNIRAFQLGDRFFLEAVKDSRIEHLKTFEKHETKPLFKGFFEIKIKQAYDYFKKRMEAVRD